MKLSYNDDILENFIPVTYDEVTETVLRSHDRSQDHELTQFAHLLRACYHARFHDDLQSLKRLYSPFNPDADTLTLKTYDAQQYADMQSQLIDKIEPIMVHANYNILSEAELEASMNQTSPYGVEVSVDFNDFDQMLLYYRGEAHRDDTIRRWQSFYLKKEPIRIDIYRRLFLLIKPKPLEKRAEEIAAEKGITIEKAKKRLKRNNPLLANAAENEHIYIKLFKDIPHADLEMLFPNTEVRISLPDKIKLGVTGGGGTIGGVITLIGKIGAAIDPISLLIALGGFGGVIWRQIKNIFTHRTRYMAALAKNLYFYNLDNNAGVLTNIVDKAEAEESKEALLAYLFLILSDDNPSRPELDQRIEKYMQETFNIPMDMEIDDGIRKLLELDLVIEENDHLKAITVEEANAKLRQLLIRAYE